MGKWRKQRRRPKVKDKKQSERFKEAYRELGADDKSESFERIVMNGGKENNNSEA
jgi:hypothetical protein